MPGNRWLMVVVLAMKMFGQDVDTHVLNSLQWRLIGSFRAGRVTSVAGVPGNPDVYYFGTPGGGVWKTTDGGHVWAPVFDKQPVASIGSLAVAASNPKVVYAGTGELTSGDGVYKSEDEGKTWTHAGLEQTRFIQAVLVDPQDPNVLVAGANSIGVAVYARPAPTKAFSIPRGVFKSMDGGKTWRQTLANDLTAGVFDLERDPDDARVMYASLVVPAKGKVAANSLIYKSTDEGSTWQPLLSKGLPEKDRGRLGISVAPGTNGQRLYAVMEQGFYRSDDAGATWVQSTTDPRILGSGYFSRIFVDTKNPDVLYMAQTSLYRSTDGGHTFTAYVGAPSGDDFHVLWIDPLNPQRMLLGVDQGAIVSVDAGKSWGSWFNQATGQFYHVITDQQFPYRAYAAQQDSGTQSVPSRSDYGEITQQDAGSIGGFEYCFIAPDPLHPDEIYSGGWYGTVVRFDRRTGQTATVFEKGKDNRVVNMPPLFFSSHDPHALYLGTQYVLRTTDEGKTWQKMSPDLTEWNHVNEAAADPDKPRPPAIEALAASPVDAGVIWAATSNRLVQLTRDGGAHWQKVTPPGLAAPAQLLYVEPSHHLAGTVYLTVGPGREAVPPQILRTRDFGVSWTPIVQGIPADQSVRVVREDPVRPGLLFAGTDLSCFVSLDDGDHWHPLTLNLPATPVTDMQIHGDDLVISTFGRGLWILDNITPIRQLTPELVSSPVALLKPADALRVRWDNYQDTPLPIETPSAKNPADGAILDYYLQAASSEAPTITIRNAAGEVVRKFTGRGVDPKLPPANVPEYWFAKPQSVEGTAGLHRFVWDLRYDSPRVLPASFGGPILQYTEYTLADHAIPHETPRQQPQGPLVVPGEYSVELMVDGKTERQGLAVKLDPRVQASQDDLEAQLALSRRILSGIEVSYDEFQKMKQVRAALEQKKKEHPTEEAAAEKQSAAAQQGTKVVPGVGPANRDFARLLNSVEAADLRPTSSQVDAVNETCAALSHALSLWKQFGVDFGGRAPLDLPVVAQPVHAGCRE
jgi:photosystem II stability/assembly factor-like uncharacterized protein